MTEKIWKKIVINEQDTFYSVSNFGEVRNDSTKTLLKGSVSRTGYRMVHLRQRIDKYCSVHRLVMKAFCPCDNQDDLQVNHKDGNKLNNHISNLEWSTSLENMRHSYITELQKNNMYPCFQYDLDGNFVKEYVNSIETAKELNLDYSVILRCVKEELSHYGKWQFKKYKKDKIAKWSDPKEKGVWVYKDNGDFVKKFDSQKECANAFGVSESSIHRYIKGTRKLQDYVFSKTAL